MSGARVQDEAHINLAPTACSNICNIQNIHISWLNEKTFETYIDDEKGISIIIKM